MNRQEFVRSFLAVTALSIGSFWNANAASVTLTGSITTDDAVVTYNFASPTTQLYTFYTTSYAGGLNANGTLTAGGGFDPLLTLFSLNSGKVVAFGGGNSICTAGATADAVTQLCNDANFTATLAPGSYELALTEFPNAAAGNLSDGFLFAGDPTATGDVCNVPGGKFLESDLAPCVQRTANYAVNITNAPTVTPEPATFLMVLPALSGVLLYSRLRLA